MFASANHRLMHMRSLCLVHTNASLEGATPPFDPELQALLEHSRVIVPLPRGVRARALARARAAVAEAPPPTSAFGRLRLC
jgi:hypothetical protein